MDPVRVARISPCERPGESRGPANPAKRAPHPLSVFGYQTVRMRSSTTFFCDPFWGLIVNLERTRNPTLWSEKRKGGSRRDEQFGTWFSYN